MADVVYVHIGAPKTGTTYLQDRLYLNRSTLDDHGVAYPVGLHRDNFGAALDLTEKPWGTLGEDMEGRWDALAGRVRRANGHVVISHELFAAATLEQVTVGTSPLGKRPERGELLADAMLTSPYRQLDTSNNYANGESEKLLGGAIRRLHDRLGLTTIMVTHDMAEALILADRVLVMDAGRIVADAAPKTLLAGEGGAVAQALVAVPREQARRLGALEAGA